MSGYRELHSLTGFQAMSSLDVKFADMPEGKRASWLRWANSHDWGAAGAHFVGDMLVTYGQAHNGEGWFVERVEHTTPRALRNWAGY